MQQLPIIERAPMKASKGEPCNGCGFCCAAELCYFAELLYGEEQPAPCPSMQFRDGRFWCGEIGRWDEKIDEKLRYQLGIGQGCTVDDFEAKS